MRRIYLFFLVSIMTIYSSNSFAESCQPFGKSFPLPKDVGFGNTYFKSLVKNFKEYGVCIVEKSEGHPTRLGKQSLRFEVKPGDCGLNSDGSWDDCREDRERHELSGKEQNDGEYWYAWSIFLPKNFANVHPTNVALGQFHQKNGHVVWMFQNSTGGYLIDNQVPGFTWRMDYLLDKEEMLGKWNDILVNVNWTDTKTGFFKIWVNGKQEFKYKGKTKSKGKNIYQKFGIYRSYISRFKAKNDTKKVPGQVVYFDEVRTGTSCKSLKIESLSYSCNDLIANMN